MPQGAVAARTENLAFIFQEVLTAIVRLRSGRQQSPDAESFRYHMREAVKSAAQDARNRAGYNSDDVRMGTLAVVGFLDESVLTSQNPIFRDWPRQPLQQELFANQLAGETFFDNVNELLARGDSAELADVLELHYLCLLLGFTGRYSGSRSGELQALRQAIAEKIRRIRGDMGPLSPDWASKGEVAAKAKPARSHWYLIAAIACLVLTVVLFAVFKISLGSGISDLQSLAARKA